MKKIDKDTAKSQMRTAIMFRQIFLTVTCIFNLALMAQNAPNITLTVKDSINSEPVSYATVELLSVTDSLLIAGITDDNGFIAIPAQTGLAKISVRFIGYKTCIMPVTALDMGVILLSEDATQLSAISVSGSNRTVKIDRDIFVITNELKAGTATSRELLGKLNGVQYNPYDQSIMVNGSPNVLILMDGIEKDQNMAKTISPDRISRVEVIKDPIGKYAADGYTAVINIITRKDFSGIDITANTNQFINFISPHGNSTFFQGGSNVNILYTYKNLNLYASYFNWGNKLRIPSFYEKRYGNLTVITLPMDYNNPNMVSSDSQNNITFGGDYLIKEDHIIALEVNYNTGNNKSTNISDLISYRNNTETGRSQSISFSHTKQNSLQTTLTYNGKWNEKSNFEADFRYRHSLPTNLSTFEQGDMFSEMKNYQIENFYRINTQYSYQFTPKFSISLGYGAMSDRFILYYDKNPNQDKKLIQNQVRHRPSVYFNYAPFQKLNFKVGAMVEFFNQKITFNEFTKENKLKQQETGFLPFANIMYRPSDNFNVTLKYNATPAYPDINSLNTVATQQDSLTWQIGNINLKPSN